MHYVILSVIYEICLLNIIYTCIYAYCLRNTSKDWEKIYTSIKRVQMTLDNCFSYAITYQLDVRELHSFVFNHVLWNYSPQHLLYKDYIPIDVPAKVGMQTMIL